MAPVTKKNTVNRLDWNIPIVQADGRPTAEFQRKWLQQASTNAAIPDVTTIPGVSAILDLITAAKGSILTRGITNWQGLAGATGHDGWLLTWNDATGLPEWRVAAITAIPAAFWIDGSGVGQMALVDVDGLEVLDGSGKGIYVPNPVLPTAMLPAFPVAANPSATGGDTAVNGVATTFMASDSAPAIQKTSSTLFGLAKVDNTTITAAAGVISAVVPATYSQFTAGSWTPTDASGAGLTFGGSTVAHYINFTQAKLCFVFGLVAVPANVSALQMQVGGLPFTVSALGVNGFPLPVDAVAVGAPCFWFFNTSTTTAGLGNYATGGAVANSAAVGNIYFACLYPTT